MIASDLTEPGRSERAAAGFLLALALYFCVQAMLRLFYATSLGLDEAELLVTSQEIKAGYGSQPPLYSWIQAFAFELFGRNILALASVKNPLLFATFAFMFFSARLLFTDERKAAVATLALFMVPQIAWESQRALSHTVIAVAVASMTLYFFLLSMRDGRWSTYVALGVSFVLGILSKYNYAIFAAVLFVAGSTIPAFRPRILSVRMLLAVAVAGALLVPHIFWAVGNADALMTRVDKFEIRDEGLSSVADSLSAFISGSFNFAVLPLILILGGLFLPCGRGADADPVAGWVDGKRFIPRLAAIGLGVVLLLVLATGATDLRDRWLQPVLFVLPLCLFVLFEFRLTQCRMRMFTLVSAVSAVVIAIGLTVSHMAPDLLGQTARATIPSGAIAERIRSLGFENGYILAGNAYVAGNLKLRFPESTVAEPEYGLWPVQDLAPKSLLIAWDRSVTSVPPGIVALRRSLCGDDTQASAENEKPVRIEVPYEHSQEHFYAMRVIVLPMCRSGYGPDS